MIGYGELVFDSGEEALDMATTFKDGSRRVIYPMLNKWGCNKTLILL